MDKLEITGPCELKGSVRISSAKNACLPIIIATLLNEGKTTLKQLPDLRDMRTLKKLLERLGVVVDPTDSEIDGQDWEFNASNIGECIAEYDLVKTMRASVLVLGPLLSRFAVYAQGETIIHNAAREPEIVDLANFLKKLGVSVTGEGTSKIIITGVTSPIKKDIEHVCIPDRIEAVTYLMAAIATNSEITIDN
eukprot:maker-scaffold7447_size3181-snap-gene-0.0 protein:Tk09495 transcript:maker-scaffold7447_size3181-snap-gene-0.0-mRNA-1 annotation:"udp-n-acetylglucosamine 1-carboxyvinyltransferase"